MANDVTTQQDQQHKVPSILNSMATRYGVTVAELDETIRFTIMDPKSTYAEYLSFLSVAKEYGLNPLTREIFAFAKKGGGIVPVVSIDGWIRIVNEHPELDAFEFEEHNDENGKLVSTTCRIFRKGRSLPIVITEYLDECIRSTDPWKMARRMLRHKAFIQCARYAFGFSGIYDEDEGNDMSDGARRRSSGPTPKPPGTPPHDANTGEIIDAQAREINAGEEEAKEPAPKEEPPKEEPPKEDPKPETKPKKAEAKKEAAAKKDEPGEDPVDELKRLLGAATTIAELDGVVSTKANGKPTRGSEIYDTLSKNDQEVVKAVYREMKAKLQPPEQKDAQQGGDDETSSEDLIAEFTKFCDSATDLDALDACMNHFEDRINELTKDDRAKVEDIFMAAEARIKNADAPDEATEEQAGGDEASEAKDPAEMTAEEYIEYARGYIAGATDFAAMKKAWFGESGVRKVLEEKGELKKEDREALRDLYKGREAELKPPAA